MEKLHQSCVKQCFSKKRFSGGKNQNLGLILRVRVDRTNDQVLKGVREGNLMLVSNLQALFNLIEYF